MGLINAAQLREDASSTPSRQLTCFLCAHRFAVKSKCCSKLWCAPHYMPLTFYEPSAFLLPSVSWSTSQFAFWTPKLEKAFQLITHQRSAPLSQTAHLTLSSFTLPSLFVVLTNFTKTAHFWVSYVCLSPKSLAWLTVRYNRSNRFDFIIWLHSTKVLWTCYQNLEKDHQDMIFLVRISCNDGRKLDILELWGDAMAKLEGESHCSKKTTTTVSTICWRSHGHTKMLQGKFCGWMTPIWSSLF